MSKLGEILQKEVLAEINGVLAEADSRAERLVREAEKEASGRLEAYRKRTEAELRAATRRAKSAAELTLSMARMQARGQAIALVKNKALASFEEIAAKPNYGEILEALAEEAVKAVGAPEAVVVHPKDQARLRAWAMQKGLELRTDPVLRLGVRIVARGGQRSVENSLPERLQRAWETLAPGVARRLWEPASEPKPSQPPISSSPLTGED
jgi:V/A-type H+-transporting ATPase subunit E